MNEFALRIRETLAQGLRRDFRAPRNSLALSQLKNAKPTPFGLVPIERVINPFSPSVFSALGMDGNWPLPQIFKGRSRTFLVNKDVIYFVNEEDWSLYPVDLYLFSSPNTLVQTLPIGNPWQLIEAYDSWFLTNGQCVVFSLNNEEMVGGTRKAYVTTESVFESGCEHRGRFVVGGFASADSLSSAWQAYIRSKIDDTIIDADIKAQNMNFGQNFILWSSIGGGDFPYWLWDLSAAKYSYFIKGAPHGDDNPLLFDRLKDGTCGFMPMPWQGLVRVVKPLGDGVAIYGDNGIAAIFLAQTTYGMRQLKTFGIHAHAVGGDDAEHVFLDKRANLWRVSADFKFELLGYREFLYPMLESEVMISYFGETDISREYVISDGHKTYHLTSNGLCENSQTYVTSAIYSQGGVVGVASYSDYLDDNETLICTDWTDFQDNLSVKKISWIQLGIRAQSGATYQVAVDYRFKKHEEGQRSRFVTVNHEGAAYVGVSGIDFRIVVKCSEFQSIDLDEIIVRWQRSDNRYVRSGNANTVNA